VAGLIHSDADILLKKVGMNPTRNAALEVLKRMGGHIEVSELASEGEPLADIRVKSSRLQATAVLEEEMAILIDELPVLAVAMAVAEGKSEVRGAEELRHKETDRIAAIGHLLDGAGVEHQLFDDGFVVNGSPNHVFESAIFNSFHDHRIAMSAAILSLRSTQSIEILEAEAASVSYPSFYEHLQKISLM
jgi:3-phosphoshikimate 1-carboxyvinyltransferase